jgi:hypothetical protein
MTQQKFLNLLFDEDQQTCFAKDARGWEVSAAPKPNDIFFSINALSPIVDCEPTESWHRHDLPRRSDKNVICHRNFLIELDNMPLNQQIEYVRSTNLPVSAITFSGSKSYHFIVSLQDPLNASEYAKLANGLHRLLPAAEKSTKNPSRLSRLPGVIRPETKLLQELVYLGERININSLPALPPSPHTTERAPAKNVLFITQQLREVQEIGVDNFIAQHFSGRNQFFFWAGRRCAELNFTQDERKNLIQRFYDRLENKKGFSIREAFAAARVRF